MSNVLVNDEYLSDIADAIRAKNGSSDTYKPSQMAGAIEDISGGGTCESLATQLEPMPPYAITRYIIKDNSRWCNVSVYDGVLSDNLQYYNSLTGSYAADMVSNSIYFNRDKTKPIIFYYGHSGGYNLVCVTGPFNCESANTLNIKYLPLYMSSMTYATSNIWVTSNICVVGSGYSPPSNLIIGTVNLGGSNGTSLDSYKNTYGSTFFADVQNSGDHQAWKTAQVDISNYTKIYIWHRLCDMQSLIHSMWFS